MGTLEAVPAPRVVPEALVQEVVSWLFATSVSFALGLALGELSARLMRRGQLHWSWAALIGATLMLLRSSLGGIVPPLGLAAGWAAVRGRRWHREDIEAGGDLGSLAADRRRPTDALRRLAEAAPTHLLGFSRPIHKQEIVVGRDRRRRTVTVPFGAGCGGTHALVLGATGSGKTVTQALLAVTAIGRRQGAIVVDPKGDPGLRERLFLPLRTTAGGFSNGRPRVPYLQPVAAAGRRRSPTRRSARAVHRAPLPPPGAALSRPRGARVSRRRREVSLPGSSSTSTRRLEQLRAGSRGARERLRLPGLAGGTPARRPAGVRDRLAVLSSPTPARWLQPET